MTLLLMKRKRRSLAGAIARAVGGDANLFGLWLYGQTATVAGGLLSAWGDARGSGALPTLTGTGTQRPTDSGTDYVFNGTTNLLTTGALTLAQPEHVVAVLNQVTWTNGDALWDGVTSTNMLLDQITASPTLRMFASAPGPQPSTLPVATYAVVSALYSAAASEFRVNGGAAVTGNPGASAAGGLMLGARGDGTVSGNVAVKAIVVAKVALTTAQRQSVERLLGAAYGVAVA